MYKYSKSCLLFVVCCLLLISVYSSLNLFSTIKSNKKLSEKVGLQPNKKLIDFKIVKQNVTLEETVTFTNFSNETITITDISSGCSCNKSILTKKLLQPNDTTVLKILWQVNQQRNKIGDEITLLYESKDDKFFSESIQIVAFVKPNLLFSPEIVEPFDLNSNDKREVFFQKGDELDYDILSCSSNYPCIKIVSFSNEKAVIELDTTKITGLMNEINLYVKYSLSNKMIEQLKIPLIVVDKSPLFRQMPKK